MFRQSPLTAAFVGYSGGGARALVDTIDDETGMQEMKGSFMKGEARGRIESPQNYGFTSVVLPAKKGKDGQIEECAEAYINFLGGNRTFAVAAVMDDRRHRPWGLKPGENAQYDDLGQMTLMRRSGLYLLTTDNPDESQQQSGGGGAAPGTLAAGGGQQQPVERMVSLRHVEKKKQERPKGKSQGQQGGGQQSSQSNGKDHKHEGETVNTEVRATKAKIEIFDGETMIARYTRSTGLWEFVAKKMEIRCSETMKIEVTNQLDIKGHPIVFNDGGPTVEPFRIP